jgi:hypothetical protein
MIEVMKLLRSDFPSTAVVAIHVSTQQLQKTYSSNANVFDITHNLVNSV